MLAGYDLQHGFGRCQVEQSQSTETKRDAGHDDAGDVSWDAICGLHGEGIEDMGIAAPLCGLPDDVQGSGVDYDPGTSCHTLGILVPL